jgi:hypothetical protein
MGFLQRLRAGSYHFIGDSHELKQNMLYYLYFQENVKRNRGNTIAVSKCKLTNFSRPKATAVTPLRTTVYHHLLDRFMAKTNRISPDSHSINFVSSIRV